MPETFTAKDSAEREPILGRAGELSSLRGLFARVQSGVGEVALIEGEAGIGKSRLLEEALLDAAREGFQVLCGAADQLERDQPFGAIADALKLVLRSPDPQTAELARMLRGESPDGGALPIVTGAPDLGFRIIESIVTLLEGLAERGPVVIALEDIHWADPSTLRALRSIARRVAQAPIALIATFRPVPPSPGLGVVIDSLAGVGRIILAPMDEQAVEALTEEIAGAAPGPRLMAQVAGASGNPLFVIQLIKALREEGALTAFDGVVEVDHVSLPPTLRLTILRRISFLSGEALQILPIAAVLGTSFSPGHLARLCGQSVARLVAPLNEILDAGVLREAGEQLAFHHELIRAAIYEDLPLSLRRSLHREVASALAAEGAGVVLVAEHLFLAGSPGDSEAVKWLREAAHEVVARSAPTAVELLERALELVGDSSPERARLGSELAPLLVQVGRSADAAALARDILRRRPEPSVEAALHRALGEVLWVRGELAASVAELEAAAALCTAHEAQRVVPAALAAHLKLFLGDVEGAAEQAQRAVVDGERLGDDVAMCLGLQTLAVAADAKGRVEEAVDLARRAVEVGGHCTDALAGCLYPHLYLGLVLIDADRISEAEDALQAGLRLAEERGTVLWSPLYHWALALLRCFTGELENAQVEVEAALGLVEEVGTRVHAPFLHGVIAWLAIQRGDLNVARESLAAATRELVAVADQTWTSSAVEDVVGAGPQWPVEWGAWVAGLLAEAQGNYQEAYGALDVAWTMATPLRYYLGYRWFGPDLVRMALATDHRDRATAVTEEVEEAARRSNVATARASALRCRGMLDADPDLLVAAAGDFRRGGRIVDAALTAEEAAHALGRAARTADAVNLVGEALATYERVGATRPAARAIAMLRSLGAPVGRRARRQRRPSTGWESLTDTENSVVALVGTGLTNRQIGEQLFVSHRTVETHVSHVFQKLGLSSRAQLSAEAARRAV